MERERERVQLAQIRDRLSIERLRELSQTSERDIDYQWRERESEMS